MTQKKPQVVFHKDINEFSFNLWLGDSSDALAPYTSQGSILFVNVSDPRVAKVKTTETVDTTTNINLKVKCLKDGKTDIVISLVNEKIKFAVTKECSKLHTKFFMIYTKGGDIVADNGVVLPKYDVHNAKQVSYIATEDEGEMELVLKSNGMPYKIEKVSVGVYEVPYEMLKWSAHRRPELESMYNKAVTDNKPKSEEEKEDDEGDDEGEYEEYEKEDATDDNEEKIFKSKEALFVKEHAVTPVELHNGERAKESTLLEPSLSGTATKEEAIVRPSRGGHFAVDKYAHLVSKAHGKDINQKKLLKQIMRISEGGTTLNIDYHCVDEGVAVVETKIFLKKHLHDDEEFSEEIKMSWIKVCEAKKVKGSDVNLMGFDIRLGSFVDGDPAFYAVRNGRVTNHFKPKSHSLMVSAEEKETSFYVSVDPEVWLHEESEHNLDKNKITIVGAQISADDKHVCSPKLFGHGARGGEVSIEALPIVIQYNCHDSGEVVLTASLDVLLKGSDDRERYLRVTWAWTKESKVTPIDILNVQMVPVELFDLDTSLEDLEAKVSSDEASLVVKKGKVAHEWRPETFTYELGEADETIAFKLTTIMSNIYQNKKLKKRGSAIAKALEFEQPHIESSSTSCHVSIRDIGEMEMLAMGEMPDEDNFLKAKQQYSITNKSPGYIVVDHKCVNTGHSTITMTLNVEGSQIIMIRWGKSCSWKEAKVDAVHAFGASMFTFVLALVLTSAICICRNRSAIEKALSDHKNRKDGFDKMNIQ